MGQDSARKIVSEVLTNIGDYIQIQDEIVRMGEYLAETEAGRLLALDLQSTARQLRMLDNRTKQLGHNTDKADPNLKLQQEYLKNRERLEAALRQIEELHISVLRRILSFLHVVVSEISTPHTSS